MIAGTQRVLFVTWDGPDQAYLESLFLPLFERLGEHGFSFDVLQYSWAPSAARDAARRACSERGIGYVGRGVTRALGPAAVIASVARGARELSRTARGYSLVMPRSMLPAAMVLASSAARERLVFDADGLSADERIELAGWSASGLSYALYREIERLALTRALAVITRTDRAADILLARAGSALAPERVHAIPNGSDETRFAPASTTARARTRAAHGIPEDCPWVLSVGSLGPQYLPEAQLALFAAIARRRPDARFTVLTGRPDWVTREWHVELGNRLTVRRAPPEQVPAIMAAADLGVALRLASFSQRAVSPIKISEYLLCGLPVVATAGVGDLDALLDGTDGPALLIAFTNARSIEDAADWSISAMTARRQDLARKSREIGLARFSLREAANATAHVLRSALEHRETASPARKSSSVRPTLTRPQHRAGSAT